MVLLAGVTLDRGCPIERGQVTSPRRQEADQPPAAATGAQVEAAQAAAEADLPPSRKVRQGCGQGTFWVTFALGVLVGIREGFFCPKHPLMRLHVS